MMDCCMSGSTSTNAVVRMSGQESIFHNKSPEKISAIVQETKNILEEIDSMLRATTMMLTAKVVKEKQEAPDNCLLDNILCNRFRAEDCRNMLQEIMKVLGV